MYATTSDHTLENIFYNIKNINCMFLPWPNWATLKFGKIFSNIQKTTATPVLGIDLVSWQPWNHRHRISNKEIPWGGHFDCDSSAVKYLKWWLRGFSKLFSLLQTQNLQDQVLMFHWGHTRATLVTLNHNSYEPAWASSTLSDLSAVSPNLLARVKWPSTCSVGNSKPEKTKTPGLHIWSLAFSTISCES